MLVLELVCVLVKRDDNDKRGEDDDVLETVADLVDVIVVVIVFVEVGEGVTALV